MELLVKKLPQLCQGKDVYARHSLADSVAKAINKRKRRKSKRSSTMNKTHARSGAVEAFQCECCGLWHIGGQVVELKPRSNACGLYCRKQAGTTTGP
jgi:hypothetical protein